MITLKENQIIKLKGRFYKISSVKWRNGTAEGKRFYLKIVREKELYALFNKGFIESKGGLKNG